VTTKLLIPIADTIPVHVCWNSRRGYTCRLVAVEFTLDCETCAVETDPTSGDQVQVMYKSDDGRHQSQEGQFALDGDWLFSFVRHSRYVGNIMWDVIWMTKDEAGRFAEYLQKQRHWHCNCAATEIFDRWGKMTGAEFVALLEEMSR